MRWAGLTISQRFLDLYLRLLDNGVLDEARGLAVNSDFWVLILPLAEHRPAWACEVIGHYFRRRHDLSMSAAQPNPFDTDGGTVQNSQLAEGLFLNAARGAAASFVAEVLPFMLRVMDFPAKREGEPPWPDPEWRYRFYSVYRYFGAITLPSVYALSG